MAGKRIVFCTFGSLGDLYPFLALAREMKDRGHSPVIATPLYYRELVESNGVEFHPVHPHLDGDDPELLRRVMDRNTGGKYVIVDLVLPSLRESYADTAAAAANADLLVTHPLAFAAMLYARKSGMPWASVALAPVSMYSIHDPSILVGLPLAEKAVSWGPFFQRQMLKAIAFLSEPLWKPYRRFEKELGLARARNPLFWGHSPQLALGLFSPALAAPQSDWPAHAHAAGFPFLRVPEEELAPDLQRFLDSGKPPIVFTLGSAAVGVAGDFFRQSIEAAQSLGQRAVLLVGRDPRNQIQGTLPRDVIAVQYAPHHAVFPHASVIVHQGGIGTTGEAMRAGKPMLVIHYSHDQPDHAARLTRLGVARGVPRERYGAATAAREIQALLQNPGYAERAAALGVRVRSENGTAAACDLLSRLLHNPNAEELSLQQSASVVA